MFKILALDQATVNTGWALISDKGILDYGLLHVDSALPNEERLRVMHSNIKRLITKSKPSFVVIEAVQCQKNFGTFGLLSLLQGTIIAELFNKKINWDIVPCSKWRKYCGVKGKSRAEFKANARKFVYEKYNITASEDEADAIGIATWAIGNITEDM